MPTYAYRCADCGHSFDVHQEFTDEALTVCPMCDGHLRKKFGNVGVTFKGSGFYRTDSRAGSTPKGKPAAKQPKSTPSAPKKEKTSAAA